MNLGYSHPVEMLPPPEGITFDVPDANHITVRGIDKRIGWSNSSSYKNKETT